MGNCSLSLANITVYETQNYDLFKRLACNREATTVNKIIASIEQIGYIPSPIIVNKNMEVIDGQNRLEALRKLNLPVQFYVVKDIGINEARQMNLNRNNWKPMDYVKSYAEEGNKSYQYLLALIEEAEFLGFQEVYGICKRQIITHGASLSIIGSGNLAVSFEEYANAKDTIKYLLKLQEEIKRINGYRRIIVTGIAWCSRVNGVDKSRLAKIIKSQYPLIRPAVSIETFLPDLSDLYNKRIDKEKRLYFETLYKIEN